LKLIRDDDNMIQGASKNLLLECLETLEQSDDVEQQTPDVEVLPMVPNQQRKKRACKAPDPVDTTSLRHSTRLNKNSESFKAKGAEVGPTEDKMFVGSFDRGSVDGVPPELSK
jgi:hypothetical protein